MESKQNATEAFRTFWKCGRGMGDAVIHYQGKFSLSRLATIPSGTEFKVFGAMF